MTAASPPSTARALCALPPSTSNNERAGSTELVIMLSSARAPRTTRVTRTLAQRAQALQQALLAPRSRSNSPRASPELPGTGAATTSINDLREGLAGSARGDDVATAPAAAAGVIARPPGPLGAPSSYGTNSELEATLDVKPLVAPRIVPRASYAAHDRV